MVDVGAKPTTARQATAEARVRCSAETLRLIADGAAAKGDVLGTARLAGVMAAKRTAELIPLCHPLPLDHVEVEVDADPTLPGVRIRATARCSGRTGVEMEALTAVAAAALTVYDMCKAVDREMCIMDIRLIEKQGGRSGFFHRPGER